MRRFLVLIFGFLVFFALLPSSAEAQYGRRIPDILRQVEYRRTQIRICAENSQSEWAFQECLRGRPLVGVIEGNRALVDDIVDAGHGDGNLRGGGFYGSASDIVRGATWGRSGDYRRGERRPPRTIISPVEGGITTSIIVGAATGSFRNGVIAGGVGYTGLRIVDSILQRRELTKKQEVEVILDNQFRTKMVTVGYRDRKGPRQITLPPGSRDAVVVLAGTAVTARINDFLFSDGRVGLKMLGPGDGMAETTDGLVFYQP